MTRGLELRDGGRDWLAELRATTGKGLGETEGDEERFTGLVVEISRTAPGLAGEVIPVVREFAPDWEGWATELFASGRRTEVRKLAAEAESERLGARGREIAKARREPAAKPALDGEILPKEPGWVEDGKPFRRGRILGAKPAVAPKAENFFSAEIQSQAEQKPEGEPEDAKAEAPKAKPKAPHVEFAHDPPFEYPDAEPAVLSLAAPFDNAREFARRLCWKAGSLAVYAWGKGFWEWNGIAYVAMPEADLKAKVYQFLDRSVVRTADDRKARFRPKPKHVNELLDGLRAGLALPSWCEPPMRLDTGERAGGVLMFRNGLVEVANGGRVEPTPKLWVHDDVGYEWRPEAECPEWLRFLGGIFPGDQEAKDCLEEFLGLSMTEDVSFQKGLMEIGVPRSGKGTSMRVAEWLGGTKSFISLDLDKWMVGEFSGEGMIGKKVLAFTDVRLKEPKWYGQNLDPGGIVYNSGQRLLKITTGDAITLPRKYNPVPWEGVLPGKVWWGSNKVPNFNDAVLPTRFVKLAFDVSFLNREDLTLSDRLRGELSGIAGRCLAAYRRAKERGRLIQPASGERLNREIAVGSDPFTQFVTECFVSDPGGTVTYKDAMKELRDWCNAHGRPELLDKIKSNNIRKAIRALPGFIDVEQAARPHGEERRMARLGSAFRRTGWKKRKKNDGFPFQRGLGAVNHVNRMKHEFP
jgi:putative DNA primase/helicase